MNLSQQFIQLLSFSLALHLPICLGFTNFVQTSSSSSLLSSSSSSSYRNIFESRQTITKWEHPSKEQYTTKPRSSTTLPMVWWLGGSESTATNSDESCEVVPVRIDRTSPNSRRIGGEITVDVPIDDVWAILTDYDNLSVHVPNLVESKRVNGARGISNVLPGSVQGDGKYKCRLFQRGAQKIIGFEFGASVTLDMVEKIIVGNEDVKGPEERVIGFKCHESAFFTEFDGKWKVVSSKDGESTTVSYVVDVRPKGPVPVVALEWRIREDVPTNLLAVKKASMDTGLEGVLAMRGSNNGGAVSRALAKVDMNSARKTVSQSARVAVRDGQSRVRNIMERLPKQRRKQLAPVRVVATSQWEVNETMAAYLNKRK